MENIFVEFLPPWVETGLQPAFYDKESGTVLQQTARMYARVNMLIRMFNKLSKNTKTEVERFETAVNEDMTQYKHDINEDMTQYKHDINETVADYIEQFNQLHDYVHDYFDNLDVQEEINNKLDDMAEQGILQEIITTYIQSNVAWAFDTVADMKAATNLVNGSFAQTLGYYAKNDGGASIYKIRTKTGSDTPDEMLMVAIGDDLVAELVVDTTINSKQCGLKGDGTTDETAKLNTFFALSNSYDKVLNNGLYITSGTVFIKGRWADQNPSTQKITFDRATIKYTGTAGNASIIIFDMKHAEINGLNIATNSNDNYVQLTGCWFTKINNWVVRSLKLSNDTTQISTFGVSSPSCEYVYFVNCRLWHGNLSIDTAAGGYINSIFFNNTAIEAHDKTHCVIFNGANSHQNINFKDCDLSYASTAVFLINDTLTGNGYVSCESCYFDSYIPLYTASNGLTLNVTNSIAASSQETLPILYSDRISMYLNNPSFVDGNNDNSDGVNYVINGDMSSSNEYPTVASNRIMGVTNNNQAKSYITSNLNANNRARVCDFTHTTASNQTLYVDYKGVPRAGHYTVYLRLKITEGSCNGVQINVSSEYPTWRFDKIGLNNEVLLVHYISNHTLTADTDGSFSVIFTNASTDLKVEFYEIGLIYGKKYVPNAKLFAGSAI